MKKLIGHELTCSGYIWGGTITSGLTLKAHWGGGTPSPERHCRRVRDRQLVSCFCCSGEVFSAAARLCWLVDDPLGRLVKISEWLYICGHRMWLFIDFQTCLNCAWCWKTRRTGSTRRTTCSGSSGTLWRRPRPALPWLSCCWAKSRSTGTTQESWILQRFPAVSIGARALTGL